MRDENGFKCHVASETHVRQMLVVGANPNKAINEYSKQFQRDFIQQLRTAHGTKAVHINHFYQEYIGNKEHVHMNATKWPSLTEFAKFVGREGICRVEETDKGLHVAWIDNSPEALRRQDAIRKKERQDKGDEEREQRLIQDQVDRAHDSARVEYESDRAGELNRPEGEKIVLNFGSKVSASKLPTPTQEGGENGVSGDAMSEVAQAGDAAVATPTENVSSTRDMSKDEPATAASSAAPAIKLSLSAAGTNKPKNVFAAKKNPLSGKKSAPVEQPKKMSEAERIMKEELDRKRGREVGGNVSFGMKRQRVG